MTKIGDVAALAKVSAATVSRVLSRDPNMRVSAATRERVMEAVRELNYVPSHAGRALRTATARAIGLVVPDVTSAVFAELAAGAAQTAVDRGLTLVLAGAEQLASDPDWVARALGEGRVDGLVVQLPDAASTHMVDDLARHAGEVILINSVDDGPIDTVTLDDRAGITAAVDHLVALGHREVGFVGGIEGSATGGRRRDAFLTRLADHRLAVPGRDAPAQWITAFGYSGPEGREAATRLLSGGPRPTAIVVANLNAALGVLAEIHQAGLRVPADISLVALHDVWYADALWPPLTTVRMPLRPLGAAAVEILLDGGRSRPTHRVIDEPPVVIVRDSTAPPSSRSGRLSAAR
ncbi:MAG: LacI family DNA-binding transcriptional regulator [Microcella sp.]